MATVDERTLCSGFGAGARLNDYSGKGHDSLLSFRVVGDVTAEDYQVLEPAVHTAVEQHGSVRLLLDLTEFHAEKLEAWGADLRFGEHYRHSIERMAIVGDRTWERWLTRLAQPFYAKEARFLDEQDAAWAWLQAES